VNKVKKLCALDRQLLQKFSSECLARLRKLFLFELVLPVINDFLEANVEKEIVKDRMIIEYAGRAFIKGKQAGEREIQEVYEKTLEIDKVYVEKALSRQFSFSINYESIEEIRKQRIKLIVNNVTTLLSAWGEDDTFEQTARRSLSREEYGERVLGFLHLYNLETRELGDSIRIILPARIAKDMLVMKLFETMQKVSEELMQACQQKVFET